MLMSRPEVSVVLCIYNGEKYLEEAIKSVLQQDFSSFELILIDDGSTDKSLNIIRSFELKDPRCRVITGPNQGLIASRNLGITQARADLIALMDADDICMPHRLSTQIQYLRDHPDCLAVGSKTMLIDPDGENLTVMNLIMNHDDIDKAHLSGCGGIIVNPSALIRKSAILEVGMYQEEFLHAEDIDLFLRLAEIGKLANIPQVLLAYRQHFSSIGHKYTEVQRVSADNAVVAARKRRGLTIPNPEGSLLQKAHATKFDVYTKWAWWALHGNNISTARKYGWLAFRIHPFRISNLRLLFCLFRGR